MKNNLKFNANISSPTLNRLINQFFDKYENAKTPITIGMFQKELKINSKIINKWKQLKNTNNLYYINYNNYLEALDYYYELTINLTLSLSPKEFSHNSFWNYVNKYFPKTEQETQPSIAINFNAIATQQDTKIDKPTIDTKLINQEALKS